MLLPHHTKGGNCTSGRCLHQSENVSLCKLMRYAKQGGCPPQMRYVDIGKKGLRRTSQIYADIFSAYDFIGFYANSRIKVAHFKNKCHICIRNPNGGIAQLARAPALQAGGRRFDSDYLHKEFDRCRTLFYALTLLKIYEVILQY